MRTEYPRLVLLLTAGGGTAEAQKLNRMSIPLHCIHTAQHLYDDAAPGLGK